MSKFDWILWISQIAHSKILLTACTDWLLYNLSLIKFCSACAKQNTAVKTINKTNDDLKRLILYSGKQIFAWIFTNI